MSQFTDPVPTLAEFIGRAELVNPAWRERARILLADAVVLSRSNTDVQGFSDIHELGAGTGNHLSWATGHRLGAADAVQANAYAVHARFQDDTEMSTWSHPGSFVIPAAAAAVQVAGGTFGQLIDAIVVGYSVTRWLGGDGYVASKLKKRGFRPSPIFAPLGAAAASARALGHDVESIIHTLNAAALVGRGTLHSVGGGGSDWRLHNAGAARDGFMIALAARAGMESAPNALLGHNGFLRTVAGVEEPPPGWSAPPNGSMIEAVWQKALPTLGDNMAVALAARHLGKVLVGRNISHVRVRMNAAYAAFPGTQTLSPFTTSTAAQASVRFVTAHILLTGGLEYRDLMQGSRPETDALADAIEVIPDESMDYTDAILEVESEGEVFHCQTSDLPATLFHRDRAEQVTVATELAGAEGARISQLIMNGHDNANASDVFDAALESHCDVRQPLLAAKSTTAF
jgi:2-methylcitrate dehydratase PrpD